MSKREIKFRAYRKETNRMSNVADLMTIAKSDFSLIEDDIIWLEYTGLKDENGKDIYEGDIIESYQDNINNKKHVGEVIYCDSRAMFLLDSSPLDSCAYSYKKVIGNIYENIELIEG